VTAFLADWLTVFVVAGLAMVSPGPNYAVTLKHSLLHSRHAGIWSAVGVAAGNLVHVVLSLLGIAVVVSQSILLFNALKWFGAAYLIYLGLKSLRAGRYDATGPAEAGEAGEALGMGAIRAFRSSFLVSVLNPKVTLFYLVLFTQVVEPGTPLLFRVVYGLTAVALSFGWYALVALFVSHGAIKDRFAAVAHWVERATGAVLIALGIRLAFSRSNG
jgi:RhtB (resistance to homoserine/threonine) family protein